MIKKPILIVAGEPNSIFLEIFFKSIQKIKIKSPIILIASHKLLKLQMIKLNFKKKITILDYKNILNYKLDNKSINLVNVDYNVNKAFEKISSKSNNYIKKSFEILTKYKFKKLINGPISKKSFLKKKYLGITEYISEKFSINHNAMLIYNKSLSVSPITTHLPLKFVSRKINKKNIINKIKLISNFYKNYPNYF